MIIERVEEYGFVVRFGVEEFVFDNVVIVCNVFEGECRCWIIEILKFWGIIYMKGEYFFIIINDGVNIFLFGVMWLI